MSHLPCSLQVPKVDVRNKEDRLGVQVHQGFEQCAVAPLQVRAECRTGIFTWSRQKEMLNSSVSLDSII